MVNNLVGMKVGCILFTVLATVFGATNIVLYDHNNYGGGTAVCNELEAFSYYYLTVMDNKATSVKITQGTCAQLHDFQPPGGQLVVIGYPYYEYSNLGTCCDFNDKCSSIDSCSRTTVISDCPPNTFVKHFATKYDNNLLSHFSASCLVPSNNTHSVATLQSHNDLPDMNPPARCLGALRGISYTYDSQRETFHSIVGNCPAAGDKYCAQNQAICGFTTEIENHTNLIKGLSVRCCDVADPAEFCSPTDFFEPILVCDALEAVAPTKCLYRQTTGIGNSTSQGEGASAEHKFYEEVGYGFTHAGDRLSINFHNNVGYSNKTAFNWNTASSNTWSTEITTEVSLDVPPCVKTELFQVAGSCSFFSVHAAYYKRVDTTCDGKITEKMLSLEQLTSSMKLMAQPAMEIV